MTKAGKTYTTFNKARLALFVRSYASYHITQYVKVKYKINDKLPSKELRKKYFNKHVIPEISRLSKVLSFDYSLLWKAIILNKNQLSKKIADKEKIKIFLSIEHELIFLAIAKQNKSDFRDPDYESELALLSIAIERTAGNALKNIDDDFSFDKQLEALITKYNYWYYKIANKYKLPTLRITPFLLRLIR